MKRTAEQEARRIEAVRAAMKRPEVIAKLKGRNVSKETREKIGAANRGRYVGKKLSEETKQKMRIAQQKRWEKYREDPSLVEERNIRISQTLKNKYTGEKASNWRGGISTDRRNDNRVHEWRRAVLIRDDFTCQICSVRGGDMHVDHIQPFSEYTDLRFEVANGRTLCRPCHYYVTFKRKMPHGSKWALRNAKAIKDLA